MSSASTELPVLFVEDDEALRETFAAMLLRLGIEVVLADSYASAKLFLEENEIAGLITDNYLGDGAGLELVDLALRRNRDAWVGIVSGYTPEIPMEIRKRVAILQKPFTQEELREFLLDFPRKARKQ